MLGILLVIGMISSLVILAWMKTPSGKKWIDEL